MTLPLVRRDACDYLSLYIPDLMAEPWARSETTLGYRLARPRYGGPNRYWEKYRVWGAQALLLSRRFVLALLEKWDRLSGVQDTRVLSLASEYRLPLWYTAPCWVDHAPLRSGFNTPLAHAPDFDSTFRLEPGTRFHPPDGVPGQVTRAEAELLWTWASDRAVLELGTQSGRATVCLAQSARHVVSIGPSDPGEAVEWARRFGVLDRVQFRRGDLEAAAGATTVAFDMAVVDARADGAAVGRRLESARPLLNPGGVLAVLGYPDPERPNVRRGADACSARLGPRGSGRLSGRVPDLSVL